MTRKGTMYVCITHNHLHQTLNAGVAEGTSSCSVEIDEMSGDISVNYSVKGKESEVVYNGKKHDNGVFHLTGQGEGKATLCQISDDDNHDVVLVGDWQRNLIAEGLWKIVLE